MRTLLVAKSNKRLRAEDYSRRTAENSTAPRIIKNCPQNLGTVLRQSHGPKGASKMLRATGHARMVNLQHTLACVNWCRISSNGNLPSCQH